LGTIVDLEGNLLQNVANIEILSLCPGLQALTLTGNPAARNPDYRLRVNELLPQLVYLDEKRIASKRNKSPRQIPRPPSEHGIVPPLRIPPVSDEQEGAVVTEQIDDAVAARPPSARGYYPAMDDVAQVMRSARRRGLRPVMPPLPPRIVRPISARGHPY
jgi:hypothetical protein